MSKDKYRLLNRPGGLKIHYVTENRKLVKSFDFASNILARHKICTGYCYRIETNSHSHMFFKIGVLKYFAIFTGNTSLGIFFNKVAKKRIRHKVFSCEFCEISKNTIFTEHLQWLLLNIS